MRKIIILCLSLVLVFCSITFASAASMSGASSGPVTSGQNVTVTFYVDASDVTSGSIVLSWGSHLQLVSGSWLLGGTTMSNFDYSSTGVFAYSSPTNISGNYFQATFSTNSYGSDTVTASGELKNGGTTVGTIYASVPITINCAHSYGGWKINSEPTCTASGSQQRTCSICGSVETQEIPAKGHSFGNWTVVKEATCDTNGSQERICSVCNNRDTQSIPALGHILSSDAEITKEATCTTHGEATGICTRCGQTATVETPFAPHTYGAWSEKKAATCTENGIRTHSCTLCGHTEDSASLPLGHDFTNGTLIQEASISSMGLYEATCSRCGAAGSIAAPCSYTDETTGLYFETELGVFTEESQLSIKEIETIYESAPKDSFNEDQLYLLETLEAISPELKGYQISATKNDSPVFPEGTIDITIPIPDGFGRNLSAWILYGENEKQELPIIINTEDNTVQISTDKLGTIAIVNLDKAPSEDNSINWVYYACVALLSALLIENIVILIKRNKKSKNANIDANSELKELSDNSETENASVIENK